MPGPPTASRPPAIDLTYAAASAGVMVLRASTDSLVIDRLLTSSGRSPLRSEGTSEISPNKFIISPISVGSPEFTKL